MLASGLTELPGGLKLTVDLPQERSATPIVLLPAMGVPAKYYDVFVRGLNRLGHPVVRVRWRDEERSFPVEHPEFGYADLAEHDAPDAITWTREQFGESPLLIGHSLGGQIASMSAAGSLPLAGLGVIASGTNHWRGSGFRWAIGVGIMSWIVAPLIVRAVGYWPGGRLGFGGRQAKTLMLDWARLGRTGRFEPSRATTDFEAGLRSLELPVLALNIASDIYVSRGATENLLGKMPAASITREYWKSESRANRGHFHWVKAEHGPAEIVHEWAKDIE
ncbi:MAG: hypothetical protein QM648_02540 [Solirubrobacterales bacterium]